MFLQCSVDFTCKGQYQTVQWEVWLYIIIATTLAQQHLAIHYIDTGQMYNHHHQEEHANHTNAVMYQ